jgi:hypothetical protein
VNNFKKVASSTGSPCGNVLSLTSAGHYQAGAGGGSHSAPAADGFLGNGSPADCRRSNAAICRSEGRSRDLHVATETDRRGQWGRGPTQQGIRHTHGHIHTHTHTLELLVMAHPM